MSLLPSKLKALLEKLQDSLGLQTAGRRKAAGVTVAAVAALAAVVHRHWLRAQADTWALQLRSAVSKEAWQGGPVEWAQFQFEVWRLLQLDVYRRVEEATVGKAFRAGVPHVSTASSSSNNKKNKSKKKKGAMMGNEPVVKDLVLIGGGHAHAFVMKNMGMKPMEGVRLTVISRDVVTPYSGMVPGFVAGAYTKEECHIDVMRLGRFAKATIIHAEAVGIDTTEKKVFLNKGRPPVSYDVLSIDIGSQPFPADFSAAKMPVTPVKPIDGFSSRWADIATRVVQSKAPLTLAVVGGGAGGVELALSMQARLQNELARSGRLPQLLTVIVLSRSATVLPSHSSRVQAKFAAILKSRGIQTYLGSAVSGVDGSDLVLEDGSRVFADEVVWCTQASTQEWLKDTGLELTPDGFIAVDDHMQSVNTPGVFACGDVAQMVNHPRPRAGVFAVRAGPPVAANLRHTLLAQPLEPYVPQSVFLGIIGTGVPGLAVASKGPMAMEGSWLWDLKDWIDRKWMASYTTALPEMGGDDPDLPPVAHAAGAAALEALSHASMRCGGCGAKVGATVLSRVLKRLELPPTTGRDDLLVGLDSPDDCAVVAAPTDGKAMVHTIDFFRSFIGDAYTFGRIAANHALSDCHAMCADASTALAVAVVPYAVEDKVEETLFQMMSGACVALAESKCALVGGHTCEGAELAMGFAVNGIVDPAKALRKDGLKPGQVLILTKPLGTGTIFAADMRVKARGEWVAGALDSMLKSNRDAAFVLRDVGGATACTDVTGFGLLGHVVEMANASGVCVEIAMDDVPLLDGAKECVELGIFSSLQPENLRLKRSISNQDFGAAHPTYPLLFDPQTAGGLVAGVDKAKASKVLASLSAAGYKNARVIGVVENKMPMGPEVVTLKRKQRGFAGERYLASLP